MSYDLTPRARRHLFNILDARADVAGLGAASRLLGRFQTLFDLIGTLGVPGAHRPDIAQPPHRIAIRDHFLIVWRPASHDPEHRLIVAIMDGRRDVPRHLSRLDR